MCVSTLTVPGSILRDAKRQEPEQAENLGAWGRVAACRPPAGPASGHLPAPE